MPFCPNCNAEYPEDYKNRFGVCPECNIPLVADRDDNSTGRSGYVTVFIAQGSIDAESVKRILRERKIPYITNGEGNKPDYLEVLVPEGRSEEARVALEGIVESQTDDIEDLDKMFRAKGRRNMANGAPRKGLQRIILFVSVIEAVLVIAASIGWILVPGVRRFFPYVVIVVAMLASVAILVYSMEKRI